MTTTRIGAPFQSVLSKVQNARVLSEEKGVDPFRGPHTDRKYDIDGDGVADARLIEAKKGASTRLELSFLDAKGRPVDTFVSGTRHDDFLGLSDTGRIWSHTHREYTPTGNAMSWEREVYERASNTTGELSERVTTTKRNGSQQLTFESDRDGNGSLETVVRR
ncbi:MAG: hypothetical protein Q8S33_34120 [Myxococcales bacterium]|nr:hypothetical protein [Myxococcales bacterium]